MNNGYPPELFNKTRSNFLAQAARARRNRRVNCGCLVLLALLVVVPTVLYLLGYIH